MKLDDIIKQIEEDPLNESYTNRGIPPIMQIHPEAKILLIGQAPGKKVEQSFIPFHDLSGDKLMKWLGIDASVFYGKDIAIMPMDFYFPGKGKTGDLPPRKIIASKYHPLLIENMPHIQLTVLIGKYAIDYYLKDRKKKNLTETVRSYQEYLPHFFPIVHPSPLNFRWHKNNPWFEEKVVPDLRHRVHLIIDQPPSCSY